MSYYDDFEVWKRGYKRRRIVEARLEDRLDVDGAASLRTAAEVLATRSVVTGDGTQRQRLASELIARGSAA